MAATISILDRAGRSAPAPVWFTTSAIFHYLGPAFAVLLFPFVGVLGVAWWRIAAAAAVFMLLVRPRDILAKLSPGQRVRLLGLGVALAAMNASFYLALDRLPLGLVAAMEFAGVMGLAAWSSRTGRNVAALVLTFAGVMILIDVRWASDPVGLAWSAANAVLFVGYVLLSHRNAQRGPTHGVEQLAVAMIVALVVITPVGLGEAISALVAPALVAAGIGVGICSSVVPYVCDQLAMSRLPRGTFALMLALLPAVATLVGAIVLRQTPTPSDILGVGIVVVGIAIHHPPSDRA